MSDVIDSAMSTAPDGYISIYEGIQRYNRKAPPNRKLGGHEIDFAWMHICALLFKRKIRSVCIKPNGTIENIPHQFWITDDARNIALRIKSGEDVFVENIVNGVPYLNGIDYRTVIECHVHPLPPSEIPNDLIFISYHDGGEDSIDLPSTYVSLYHAVEMFTQNAMARDEEYKIKDNDYAKDIIFDLIYSGKIRTFHKNKSGLVRPLRQEEWAADGPIMLQIQKDKSLINNYGKLIEFKSTLTSQLTVETTSGPEDGEIIILNKDIIAAITGKIELEKTNRGRPKDYDRELFLIKAFEVMWMPPSEVPENRERHIEDTIEAFALATNGSVPSKSWARPIINKLWDNMGLKGGDIPPGANA